MISIQSLMVPSREAEVDFPGVEGFKVKIAFQSREELIKLRKKATTTKFKNRKLEEDVDEELFLSLYTKAVVKGWSGLTVKGLSRLMLVDTGKAAPDAAVEFNEENALALMKGCSEFDSFVSDTVSDIANFPQSSSVKSVT